MGRGKPPLEWAAEYNKPFLIHYLLDTFPHLDINMSVIGSKTNPLCMACEQGLDDAVIALIDRGADVNYSPGKPGPAIVRAVRKGYARTVQMLLDAGADPRAGGENLLHLAAKCKYPLTLRVILRWMEAYPESMPGINSITGSWGCTALHLACEDGAVRAAKLLLESGADIDATCCGDRLKTPLSMTVGYCSARRRVMVAALLLSWGANVEGRTTESLTIPNFDTPLHDAVKRQLPDSYELVSLLLANGAAPNALNRSGSTALRLALEIHDLDMMRAIVNGGGDINMVDAGGSSAVHVLATWPISPFTSSVLLFFKERGADMFLVNKEGVAPRVLARMNGWDLETIEETWGSGV